LLAHRIAVFWSLSGGTRRAGASFFPGCKLNFAENLLRFRDDHPAIIFKAETNRREVTITYRELYDRVARLAAQLSAMGVVPGDRVVAYTPCIPDAIIAMLAATRCVPITPFFSVCFTAATIMNQWANLLVVIPVWVRFGQVARLTLARKASSTDSRRQGTHHPHGVSPRVSFINTHLLFLLLSDAHLEQISPKVVFATDGYFYKGNRVDTIPQLREIVEKLPSVEKVIMIRFTIQETHDLDLSKIRGAVYYDHFVPADMEEAPAINFAQLPFNHPVYVMYSSGTTGLPKCLVQGPGVVLNHLKEHMIVRMHSS
jgi:acetoacetyl-CoA synthetase